jgi:hypothetical protein
VSTFLQLCAKLAQESGAIGAAPSSVTDQSGRQKKAVDWVRDAWLAIQNDLPDADFLQAEFEGSLVAETLRYTGASLDITNFARWVGSISLYPAGDQSQERELKPLRYDSWRRTFDFGTHDAGTPCYWAVDAGNQLCVGPKPDAAYVIRGFYRRTPQELAANGDIPILPERFHDAIVHRAHMMLAASDEAWDAYKGAQTR